MQKVQLSKISFTYHKRKVWSKERIIGRVPLIISNDLCIILLVDAAAWITFGFEPSTLQADIVSRKLRITIVDLIFVLMDVVAAAKAFSRGSLCPTSSEFDFFVGKGQFRFGMRARIGMAGLLKFEALQKASCRKSEQMR